MNQGELFTPIAPVNPSVEAPTQAPFQPGSHSSYTGAMALVECWPERQAEVLQLLAGGPKTRQELAALTPYGINGICSVVKALLTKGAIEKTGDYDSAEWDGHTTRRERLRVKR